MEELEISLEAFIKEWDRKLPATHLMGQLFIEKNRKKYNQFYSELADAVVKKDFANLKAADGLLKEAKFESPNADYLQTVENLTKIIKHTPKSSRSLRRALAFRAYVFTNNGCYEQAIIDNELILKELSKTNQQKLEEIAKLIECYVELGYYKKVQDYLIEFKRIYDLQFKRIVTKNSSGVKVRKPVKNDELKEKCQDFYKKIRYRVEQAEYKSIRRTENVTMQFQPFRGFNENPKIRNLSASCSLVYKNKRQMILSNCKIPKGEIVGIENPYLQQQIGIPSQCDSCYTRTKIFIPCFDCHFKNYCCYECKVKDKKWHQFECMGYKLLVIPILKCEMLFRLFVHYLFLFRDDVFHSKEVRQSKTAIELYNKIWKHLALMPSNILNDEVIAYDILPEVEYNAMVLKSFRLTIMISEHTTILKDFFSKLSTEREELEIFIATFLLALSVKLLTSSFAITTTLNTTNAQSAKNGSEKPNDYAHALRATFNHNTNFDENIFKYFGFNMEKMKIQATAKILNAFESFWIDDPSMNLPLVFANNENYYLQNPDDIVEILMNFNSEDNCAPGVTGLYLNTLKFRHSCDPNLRLIYQPSGMVLVKASREIQTGELLTISYGCHFKQADNNTRLACAKRFNISCPCDYCNGKFYPDFAENIICWNCKRLVSPTEILCVVCGYDMIKTNNVYKYLMWDLEYNTIPTGDERIKFYNLVLALLVYEEIIPSTNHMFVGKLLSLTEFLAQKNFLYETYVFLTKSYCILDKIYVEMSVELLHACNMLLNPAITILMNNVNTPSIIPGNLMDRFYTLSSRIAEKMLEINDFNNLYDEFTCELLSKYQLLLNLKIKIYSSIIDLDMYRNIVTSVCFTNKNMNPFIQSDVCDSVKVTSKSDNNSFDKDVSDSKDKVNASYYPNEQTFKLDKISEEVLKNISPDREFGAGGDIIVKNDFNYPLDDEKLPEKSEEENFTEECESFFMDLFEKKVESMKLILLT